MGNIPRYGLTCHDSKIRFEEQRATFFLYSLQFTGGQVLTVVGHVRPTLRGRRAPCLDLPFTQGRGFVRHTANFLDSDTRVAAVVNCEVPPELCAVLLFVSRGSDYAFNRVG